MARRIPSSKDVITIDFETFWSTDFTLSKMPTSEYVRSPLFSVHCCAIKHGNNKPKIVWGHDAVGKALKAIDWSSKGMLAQNTQFDGFILSEVYGCYPSFYFDTKSNHAGLFTDVAKSNRLVDMAPFYGVGIKDDGGALESTKGLTVIPKEWRPRMAKYCMDDAQQCWDIFNQQRPAMPESELRIVDLVIRLFTRSALYIDINRARNALADEMMVRRTNIMNSGVTEDVLNSNDKFAEALGKHLDESEIPRKFSTRTNKMAWAFSQTDEAFLELREHENIKVARLVIGRLAAKSTQAETRAYRLIEAGSDGRPLPVGYTYSAAKTHRLGGNNKMNLQNLTRGGELRRSIIAPPGHVIVVADSAQIEARTNAWLSGQQDVLDIFNTGGDVYKHMAASIYGVLHDNVTKEQRFIGKIAVLGLGYGMGHRKFQTTLALGTMGPSMKLSLGECQRIVNLYRNTNNHIVAGWREAERMLNIMLSGNGGTAFNGIIEFDATTVWLPNGMPMHYPNLQRTETGIIYNTPKGKKKIYGGKMVENLVQAIARIIVFDQLLNIDDWCQAQRLKKGEILQLNMTTHDEGATVAPERMAQKTLDTMVSFMRVPPAWAKDLPLNADGGFDACYSK